mmetsp:Transcript_6354/g.8345  ORF Transcript_6354/g.8345 Transcript_6354/m.8345 type:complete len:216 (+) Transcript_6354:156-803(+)
MDLLAGYNSDEENENATSTNEIDKDVVKNKEDNEDEDSSNESSSENKSSEEGSGEDEDDSDNEDKSDEEDKEEEEEGVGATLPSAADLFSSTAGPDFLETSVTRDFIAPSLKRKSLAKDPEEVARQRMEKKKKTISATAASGVTSEKEAIKFNKKEKPRNPNTAGPFMPKAEKEKKKANAKERVKAQRLKGQAGIGPDFRTWKSEEEMKMRQGFD